MKTIITIMCAFNLLLFTNVVYAQEEGPCGCTPNATDTNVVIPICTYIHTEYDPNPPYDFICSEEQVCTWASITVRLITCGTESGILFGNAILHDDRSYYNPYTGPGGCDPGATRYPDAPGDFNCPQYSNPLTLSDYRNIIKVVQNKAMNAFGLNSDFGTWLYPIGCLALQTITWDTDTCYSFALEGPDSGIAKPLMYRPTSTQLAPCEDSTCCKFTYEKNQTTGKYHYSYISNDTFSCENSNPTLISPSMQCKNINGDTFTRHGTITNSGVCESFCDAEGLSFTTNPSTGFQNLPNPLDFNIAPIPTKDIIIFSSTDNLENIAIYNSAGTRVINQNSFNKNSIDLSRLENGVYFVRIQFKSTAIRTIKILKN